MFDPWLIYGAYGYTGRLVTAEAVRRGERPVLAGRDAGRTRAVAEAHGLEHRAVSLDDAAGLREALADVAAVVHTAGPFRHTWREMAEACLATGTHYLDVTGEIDVFEALHGLDARAKEAGIALLPGVGFDVVPTDCAAARAAARLDAPTHLEIAFRVDGSASVGTTKSMVEGLRAPPRERRDGEIAPLPEPVVTATIPFSDGERLCVAIPWGDVSTAYHSTGVPNVRTYTTLHPKRVRWLRLLHRLRPVLALGPVQGVLKWLVERRVEPPTAEERARSRGRVWCRARDGDGGAAVVELTTPGGYDFTARSAVAAVRTLLANGPADGPRQGPGGPQTGFLTPSLAFGPGFVDGIEGVEWVRR